MNASIVKWVAGLLGGLAIAWTIYAGIIRPVTKPNPSTKQEAQEMTNNTYNVTPRFGCATVKIYGGKDEAK